MKKILLLLTIILVSCAVVDKPKSYTATRMATDQALLPPPSHIAPTCPCGVCDWEMIEDGKWKCRNCGCIGYFLKEDK